MSFSKIHEIDFSIANPRSDTENIWIAFCKYEYTAICYFWNIFGWANVWFSSVHTILDFFSGRPVHMLSCWFFMFQKSKSECVGWWKLRNLTMLYLVLNPFFSQHSFLTHSYSWYHSQECIFSLPKNSMDLLHRKSLSTDSVPFCQTLQ